jgi:hypothetical protein
MRARLASPCRALSPHSDHDTQGREGLRRVPVLNATNTLTLHHLKPRTQRLDRAAGEAKHLKAMRRHCVCVQHEINLREQRGRRGGLGCVGGVERLQIVTDQADVGK